MSPPSTTPLSSPYHIGGSLCDITGNMPELAGPIFQVETAGRKREMQTYMMVLDGIETEADEQDALFTKLCIETVHSSYLAVQNHVRQYTQFLTLLKCEEDAWAQRASRACCLMPDYKPGSHSF
ncbi:uncharacterized protein F5147DRAFT_769153 [Suillus discolor]|uniref:Uncharacterized protein n=1 Tax=Suillus discolor TaxID=1912936 RepID=A0A9P7FG95_9AGAM|nr:uncharacterized protein F5147DRAFT_769153 [Suillus discolor]KAG2115733.1 hypothetical protein F5147DRAFT_769153 [Suillus discolor]